jgi:cation-transporting ATPase 13A3/4/5
VKLLFLEVLNPFYVFQIFSVSLWLSDNYYYYAASIILMSIFGITSTIVQTRQVRDNALSMYWAPPNTQHTADVIHQEFEVR